MSQLCLNNLGISFFKKNNKTLNLVSIYIVRNIFYFYNVFEFDIYSLDMEK